MKMHILTNLNACVFENTIVFQYTPYLYFFKQPLHLRVLLCNLSLLFKGTVNSNVSMSRKYTAYEYFAYNYFSYKYSSKILRIILSARNYLCFL